MPEKPKYIQELTTTVALHEEQIANLRRETADLGQKVDALKESIAELRQENAVSRQRLDDHLKRVELWSGRFWTLITILVGALLSLASGLVLILAKK